MTEKPILFKAEMVKAFLEGRKTMTRRVIKPPAPWVATDEGIDIEVAVGNIKCPYQVGQRLWVRETWKPHCKLTVDRGWIEYKADGACQIVTYSPDDAYKPNLLWKSPIFMPRWASRITLEITNIRVERVQDITEEDAQAEGFPFVGIGANLQWGYRLPLIWFSQLWDSINAKPKPVYTKVNGKRVIDQYISYPWEDVHETREHRGKPWIVCGNPWVFPIEFKRIEEG